MTPPSSARAARLAAVLALACCAANAFTNARPRGDPRKCLTRFWKRPANFAPCLSTPCFVFQHEDAFTELDPSMRTEAQQVLFQCGDPRSRFPRMRGSIWGVLNRTAAGQALCVWAGRESSFDDMTAFVSAQAGTRFQFGVTGLLLESPSRVSDALYPSSSLLDSSLVIVGPPSLGGGAHTLEILSRPFRREAWVLFASMVAVLALFGITIVAVFTPDNFRWHVLFFHLMGEGLASHPPPPTPGASADPLRPGDPFRSADRPPTSPVPIGLAPYASVDLLPESAESSWHRALPPLRARAAAVGRSLSNSSSEAAAWAPEADLEGGVGVDAQARAARYRAALWLFRTSTAAFVIIFVLFYEIAVVNVLVKEATTPRVVNIKRLPEARLREFAVLKSSGIEDIWRETADPFGIYNGSIPWYRCTSSSDCFDKMLDPDHPAKFTVTFDNFAHHHMIKRGLCRKLVIYNTDNELYLFGAGWLFGKGIPPDFRRKVDKDILDLRVSDKMRELMRGDKGPKEPMKCVDRGKRISEGIVGIAVLILIGPSFLLLTAILIVVGCKRRHIVARNRQR